MANKSKGSSKTTKAVESMLKKIGKPAGTRVVIGGGRKSGK